MNAAAEVPAEKKTIETITNGSHQFYWFSLQIPL